jgi:enterochelin esterase-like enzyme
MFRRLAVLAAFACAMQAGSLQRIKIHGKHLEHNTEGDSADREVSIYLPDGYASDTARRYPVLYLLHGSPLTDQYWTGRTSDLHGLPAAHISEAMDRGIASGAVKPMIIVMPNAFSKHGGSMYSGLAPAAAWIDFVTQDLTGYIDAHYRTIADRASRGLAGHSMGAYGAVKIGTMHPEVFSNLYIMSVCCMINIPGANISGLRPLVRQQSANLKQYGAIAIDVGTQDGLLGNNQELDREFTDAGIPHTFETYEGDHMNRIQQRIETKVLPFFSAHLKN